MMALAPAPFSSDLNRTTRAIFLFAGGFSTLLGALVLFGWFSHTEPLIRVFPGFAPMQANTALGFVLSGIAMLATVWARPRAAAVFAGLAIALALVTLVEYVFDSDIGIDQLLLRDYLTPEASRPGRMAPNTAICFLLAGIALTLTNTSLHALPMIATIASAGLIMLIFSATTLFGSITGIDTEYWMGNLTRMAVHTSAGFLALGLAILTSQYERIRTDIAERRRNEARLEDAIHELNLQKFAIDEHAIVAITDPKGVITYVNEQFCQISGYTREELIGRTHRVINSGHHPRAFFAEMWKTIAGGNTWNGEICNRARDGSIYWVDTTIVPFHDAEGHMTQYVAIRADITERKIKEKTIEQMNDELRQKNAELEQFVYTVSHDLKSPIVTMLGYTGLLRQEAESGNTEELLSFVDAIKRAAERMHHNVDDLLQLSRVGRVAGDVVLVDTRALVERLVTEMQPQINDLDAEVIIDDDIPQVHADEVRLNQVVQNFLSNALKYGVVEGRRLQIRVGGEVSGDEVVLSVTDNGPGIEPQYAERIFALFQRLETGKEGTGVGLAIVRRIAEVHGGRAWFEPDDGGGATFRISFPRTPISVPPDIMVPGSPAPVQSAATGQPTR